MADKTLNVRVKHRYDTEANWTSKNPVLLAGELAFSKDKNGRYKVGDGTSKWTDLPYATANSLAEHASREGFEYGYAYSKTITIPKTTTVTTYYVQIAKDADFRFKNYYIKTSGNNTQYSFKAEISANAYMSPHIILNTQQYNTNEVKNILVCKGTTNSACHNIFLVIDSATSYNKTIYIWSDNSLLDTVSTTAPATATELNVNILTEDFIYTSKKVIANISGSATSAPWSGITGKPSTYPPSSHTHSYLPLSGGTLTGNLTVNGGITTSSDIIIPSICFSQDKDSIALGMTADNTIIVPNHKIAIGNLLKANGGISTEDISTTNIDITKLTFTGSTAASINFSNRKVSINSAGLNVDNGATFGAAISVSGSITANGSVRFIDYYSESTGDGNTRRAVSSSVIDGLKVGYLKSKTNSSTSKKQFCVMGQWGKEDDFGNATTKGSWTTGYILIDSTSDVRLKKNIKNTDISALPIINQMKVRQFDWKETGVHQQLGLVADELDKFDPLLTVGGGYEADGSMYVKQIDRLLLTEYAIKGIQEQQDEIVELQKENKELKQKISEIDTLKDELVQLKALIMNK